MTSRAEELIACLEAEIVKRDARIAELEAHLALSNECLDMANETRSERGRRIAALKAQQPSGVVLPERELFEEWADEQGFCLDCKFFEEGNNFESVDTRMAFDIWMARARLNPCRAQAVPDGYVVVPVEPTQAMFEAGRTSASGSYAEKLSMAGYWRAMLAAAPSAKKEG